MIMNKKGMELNWSFVAVLVITIVLIVIAIKVITGFRDESYGLLDILRVKLGL